jgi:hypothetical protein
MEPLRVWEWATDLIAPSHSNYKAAFLHVFSGNIEEFKPQRDPKRHFHSYLENEVTSDMLNDRSIIIIDSFNWLDGNHRQDILEKYPRPLYKGLERKA